ncbi:Zinc finger protein CONSTANS-LIKE 16 [Sesamum angolense]|uniref:Zinc finger protein CONSTANS-LIKE 16 n=1 Tax=Sesamum angolense TaxID=2727404 RepID=A0AAE1WLW8_9LAMI|nr:Zinc finger protein CONSTANS-LIKE 16 [Sesamum angolense]
MNIVDQCKAANALGGKTARACDSCLLKRARWFCSADDAFLCQSCDVSVHSANQLASRHERVRLEASSFKGSEGHSSPAWHQGFTRKARTPRQGKPTARLQPPANHPLPLVPEINAEDGAFSEENEEQFLYRVPVFDPFADEFCTETVKGEESDDGHDLNLAELLSTCDDDLAEFAADVESLLGTGAEEDSGCPIYCKDEDNNELLHGKGVKIEEEEDDDDEEVQAVIACHFDPALDMELNWDFDYASSMARQDTKNVAAIETTSSMDSGSESHVKKRMLLRLNYEAVIAAWAAQGSPWTNGVRPHFNLDEFMVTCLEGDSHPSCGGRSGANDAEREARVLRYKEKRRTRLFSKKIRYEVRKLNAEKRPRMKGRFVKRTNFSGSSSLPYLINK